MPVLFSALLLCVLAIFLIRSLSYSSVETSAPRLIPHGTYFTAECNVTNHTDTPVSVRVQLTIAAALGLESTSLDHREIEVLLGPLETRHLQSDFPNNYRVLPTVANAEVLTQPTPSATPRRPSLDLLQREHPVDCVVIEVLCAATSSLLITRMWLTYSQDSFSKKLIWSFVLLVPLIGWLFYGGFFHPPDYNETRCWDSGNY